MGCPGQQFVNSWVSLADYDIYFVWLLRIALFLLIIPVSIAVGAVLIAMTVIWFPFGIIMWLISSRRRSELVDYMIPVISSLVLHSHEPLLELSFDIVYFIFVVIVVALTIVIQSAWFIVVFALGFPWFLSGRWDWDILYKPLGFFSFITEDREEGVLEQGH